MEKKIVIINGSGGVGKDTFVSFCAKHMNIKNSTILISTKKEVKTKDYYQRYFTM